MYAKGAQNVRDTLQRGCRWRKEARERARRMSDVGRIQKELGMRWRPR